MFRSISTKITLVVFAINLILGLGSASLQLYREYQADVALVNQSLQQIRSSYLAPLEASAFALDIPLLKTHLEGMGSLPGIRCAVVELDKGDSRERLQNTLCTESKSSMRQGHLLETIVSGTRFHLGKLIIHYSNELAWNNMQRRLLFVLGMNVLQTFLAALAILGILHLVASRPLASLRKQLESSGSEHPTYKMPETRLRGRPDEIDLLVKALNDRQLTIRQLFQNLQDSNQELAKLLNVVSHDLRTPMVNLSGFSQESILLLESHERNQPFSEEEFHQLTSYLQRIRQNSELFHAQLVGLGKYLRMLDQPIHCKSNSILDLWNSVCTQFSLSIARSGAAIQIDFRERICYADRDAMLAILGQILDNALKFCVPNQTPTILVASSRTEDGAIQIEVEDRGIGISANEISQIFGLFYQSSKLSDGVGIGLPLAQKLALRMGGNLEAERIEPHGLRVRIRLPSA